MTATTTRQRAPSILVTGLLFLGLVGLSVLPLSCGTEPDAASEGDSARTPEAQAGRSVLLNVGVQDETETRPLSGAFLVESPDGTRWRPGALDGGGATNGFEEYPVGETRTLRLYPEGDAGPVLEVSVTMKSDMSSVLASSRTDILVYDDRIVAAGPAVPDGRMTLDRPAPSDAP